MSKTQTQFDKFFKESGDISAQYADACTKSGTIFMKGCEEIFGAVFSLAQSSAEKQSKLVKEALNVKNINEFAEIQSKIAQAHFDDFMNGATKISEIGAKIMTDSAEPVNAQMSKTIKKATEAVAA